MDILKKIRDIRKSRGYTQNEMANKLNMARTTYQAIENGVNNLKIDDFFAIVKILEIPLSTFSSDDLIVISKNDLSRLKEAATAINEITDKLASSISITIGDNSPSNINIGSNTDNKNSK